MESIKNAANFVSDKAQSSGHAASEEANKNIAKDNNAPIGDRLRSAGNAVSDKAQGEKHDASAEANKQAATH